MKLVLLLLSIVALNATPVSLLVIDMNGKKAPRAATEFSIDQYLARSFPIYEQDLKAVVKATEEAAKLIYRKPLCDAVDTLRANHTLIIVRTECAEEKLISVRYVTRVRELNFLCDFELIKKEADDRKAQVELVDFAAYLSQ